MPQDEWITDPQDGRLARLPEWVPRPGETAVIEEPGHQFLMEITVKGVTLSGKLDTDALGETYLNESAVCAIGKRYRQLGYRG